MKPKYYQPTVCDTLDCERAGILVNRWTGSPACSRHVDWRDVLMLRWWPMFFYRYFEWRGLICSVCLHHSYSVVPGVGEGCSRESCAQYAML